MSVRRPLRAGFTLLELLVVLIVIVLVAGVVGPRAAGSLTRLQLKTGAKNLASALRYARSQAASQSVTYVALLDFRERTVTVLAAEKEAPTGDGPTSLGTDEAVLREGRREYTLPAGVRFYRAVSGDEEWQAGTFPLVFYPDGGSSGGEVVLADKKDRRYAIHVDFITGAVVVREGEPA